VRFDRHARTLWRDSYPQLTQPADGLPGHLTARAEAHTIRLGLTYALIDGQTRIYEQHLQAALALWDYAARSAAWTLGHSTGDRVAEQIHTALLRSPAGLTRTQLRDLCQRTFPASVSTKRSPTSPPPAAPLANERSQTAAPPSSGPRIRAGGLTTLPSPRASLPHRAGRRWLSPSEARGRDRSDLDSPRRRRHHHASPGRRTNTFRHSSFCRSPPFVINRSDANMINDRVAQQRWASASRRSPADNGVTEQQARENAAPLTTAIVSGSRTQSATRDNER